MEPKVTASVTLILSSLFLVSCGNPESNTTSASTDISSPVSYKSALESAPQSAAKYLLLRLDGVTQIDGTENSILVCTSKKEYCVQTCISIYRPDIERWSVFKTDFLNGGKCVAYALAYSDGQTIPKMKYWEGNYVQNSGQVTGSCIVNAGSPDIEGRAYFSFVRPANASSYYLHTFFDSAGNLTGSVRILNFLPPAMWSYHDSGVTNADITPQLTNWSCIKESEVSGALQ